MTTDLLTVSIENSIDRIKLFILASRKSALKINRDVSFSEVADDLLVEVQREMKIKER